MSEIFRSAKIALFYKYLRKSFLYFCSSKEYYRTKSFAMLFRSLLIMFFVVNLCTSFAQTLDSLYSRIEPTADFRFRVEHDWNSRKSDGTFREDRTRLRYRLRAGAKFSHKWYSMGFRLRTGQQNKQQDPQLTIGEAYEDFGTLPVGFEKIYFKGVLSTFQFWLGKNNFPFEKNNELFWSDNAFQKASRFPTRYQK